MTTKADLINGAYSQLRISGITVQPTPEDNTLALNRLENMMAEFSDPGRNICVGYAFEDDPDLNTLHNVERQYWYALECNLAMRLVPDFGKTPSQALIAFQQSGYSFLSASTAPRRQTQYPSRMPRGSGNTLRYDRYRRYNTPQAEIPLTCASITMAVDDVDDFVEHFDSYLKDAETVSSHTIEADTGLTVVSESLTSPDVDYRIKAVGNSGERSDSLLQVRIVATTSLGRIETRLINFQVIDTEL